MDDRNPSTGWAVDKFCKLSDASGFSDARERDITSRRRDSNPSAVVRSSNSAWDTVSRSPTTIDITSSASMRGAFPDTAVASASIREEDLALGHPNCDAGVSNTYGLSGIHVNSVFIERSMIAQASHLEDILARLAVEPMHCPQIPLLPLALVRASASLV